MLAVSHLSWGPASVLIHRGVPVVRKMRKLAAQASDTAEIHFGNVRVPIRNRIGDEGKGFQYQMKQFQKERLYASLGAIGHCEKAIAETIEYTRMRRVFGKSILDNQVVHFRLAELTTEVEALRALCWRAVKAHVDGEDCTKLASMANLKAGRLSREVTDSCLQYFGVGDVQFFRGRRYSMRVWLDPDKLTKLGITAVDVQQAIAEQNVQVAAGKIEQSSAPDDTQFEMRVSALGRLATPETRLICR